MRIRDSNFFANAGAGNAIHPTRLGGLETACRVNRSGAVRWARQHQSWTSTALRIGCAVFAVNAVKTDETRSPQASTIFQPPDPAIRTEPIQIRTAPPGLAGLAI